jgi:MFS family permease
VNQGKLRWPAEIVLLGSGVFGALALSALSPVLPEIQQAFRTTPNAAFWTKAVVTVDGIAMLAAPFAGIAAARLGGPRRLMIACYLLFLVAGLGGAFMPGLTSLIFMRFLVGVAGAMLITLAITLIGENFEGRARELRIGANHATGALLIGLMVPLAGWLGDVSGWRAAFAVHLLAMPFLLCVLASPELSRPLHAPSTAPVSRAGWLEVLPIALVGLVAGSIALSVPIFLPFHLREIGVKSAAVSGLMFMLVAGCSVLSSLSFGLLRRFMPRPAVFFLSFGLWAVGLATAGLAATLPIVAAGVIVIGFGGGLMQPSIFSLLATMSAPSVRARNNGILKACFYGGPFIGTSLLQLLLGHYPAGLSLLALGGLAAVLALGAFAALIGSYAGPALRRLSAL